MSDYIIKSLPVLEIVAEIDSDRFFEKIDEKKTISIFGAKFGNVMISISILAKLNPTSFYTSLAGKSAVGN